VIPFAEAATALFPIAMACDCVDELFPMVMLWSPDAFAAIPMAMLRAPSASADGPTETEFAPVAALPLPSATADSPELTELEPIAMPPDCDDELVPIATP
jgi:hypothetical protein